MVKKISLAVAVSLTAISNSDTFSRFQVADGISEESVKTISFPQDEFNIRSRAATAKMFLFPGIKFLVFSFTGGVFAMRGFDLGRIETSNTVVNKQIF